MSDLEKSVAKPDVADDELQEDGSAPPSESLRSFTIYLIACGNHLSDERLCETHNISTDRMKRRRDGRDTYEHSQLLLDSMLATPASTGEGSTSDARGREEG